MRCRKDHVEPRRKNLHPCDQLYRNNGVGAVPPSGPVGSRGPKNVNESPHNKIHLSDCGLNNAGTGLDSNKHDPALIPGANDAIQVLKQPAAVLFAPLHFQN
jgi:hypothetical protein